MPMPATHGDALRIQQSSADLLSMKTVGTLAGIVVLCAAARNGPGLGFLESTPDGITWTAPGSSTPGQPQDAWAGGTFLIEDGEDASKWLRVQTYAGYLPTSSAQQITILDAYNALGPTDVSAANASAGITETNQYQLKNVSANTITSVLLWIDAAVIDISVSQDGTNYYTPTSNVDAHVMSWASIASGATVTLWVKRIIPSSSTFDPSILNLFQYQWNGIN